jgi:phospholipid/cholesterol/gamma-HCH transport system substrate-binding protein
MAAKVTGTRTFLLGLLFLVALGTLAYYTLFLTNINWFKQTYDLQVHFPELNGLKEGDPVLVAGMRWGRIKSMELDFDQPNDKRITVIATLEKPLTLRENYKIEIEDTTLLGGRNLSIDPGPATGKELPRDMAFAGSVAPSPLDALGKLVTESQRGVTQIVEDLAAVTQNARDGKGVVSRLLNDQQLAEDLAESMRRMTLVLGNLERVTSDLAGGKGTAGMLLTNTEVYDNLAAATRNIDEASSRMAAVLGDIQSGKGTLGRLIEDSELADTLASTIRDARSIVERIEQGEGTLGILVNDDSLGRSITQLVTRLESGEGSLGKLLTRDDIYENLRETTENVAMVSGMVRRGEGSFGRILTDDELYIQIKTVLSIAQRALEEYREAAPITTFTSVFFGAF